MVIQVLFCLMFWCDFPASNIGILKLMDFNKRGSVFFLIHVKRQDLKDTNPLHIGNKASLSRALRWL